MEQIRQGQRSMNYRKGQAYVLEVFALIGEEEGDGTTLKAVASKCLEFRNNFKDKDKKSL